MIIILILLVGFFTNVILSHIVALQGRHRRIGYFYSLLISFFFTPLIGILIVIASPVLSPQELIERNKENQDEENVSKPLEPSLNKEQISKIALNFAFQKENYKWLIIGLIVNVLGFMLMIGGGSDDPTKFNADELFSPVRLTVAPILIIAGYIVIIYAIMKKPKKN